MKMGLPSYWIALSLLVLIAFWLANGEVEKAQVDPPQASTVTSRSLPKVAFRLVHAQPIQRDIVIQGQVEAVRSIILRARLDGVVERVLVESGKRVSQATLLLKLAEEDIPALMAEATAQIRLAESELNAATSLQSRGLLADTQLKTREAALASAEAMAARLRKELASTQVKAPFAGIVEARFVEIGEVVQQHDALVHLIDDSQVTLVGQIAQQDINLVSEGLPVTAILLSGQTLNGRISFISSQADIATRTFQIEAELDNPDFLRVVGATASLVINTGSVQAHSISPALLTLDNKGRLSVEHLSSDNRVLQTPVQRVRSSISELWVSGLPTEVRIITLGKGYATPGQQVRAEAEDQLLKQAM